MSPGSAPSSAALGHSVLSVLRGRQIVFRSGCTAARPHGPPVGFRLLRLLSDSGSLRLFGPRTLVGMEWPRCRVHVHVADDRRCPAAPTRQSTAITSKLKFRCSAAESSYWLRRRRVPWAVPPELVAGVCPHAPSSVLEGLALAHVQFRSREVQLGPRHRGRSGAETRQSRRFLAEENPPQR